MKWEFKQIAPAVARGSFNPSMLSDSAYSAEIKLDGDRRIAQFCGSVVRFTGRTLSKKDNLYVEKTDNVPHLALGTPGKRSERIIKELTGCVLDGEMIVEPGSIPELDRGGRSKHTTSIMGSAPDVAIAKQEERGWLRYVVFDCLYYSGEDVRGAPQHHRRQQAADIVRRWANPYVTLSEECPDSTDKAAWLTQLYEAGEEGMILKNVNAEYGDRSAWVKVKRQMTVDAFIVGFDDPKQESKKKDGSVGITRLAERGLIGALRLAQIRDDEKWECATVSGMDDALREEISRNPEAFIGHVVEIEANGREPSGRFRHPRFNRFRPDKRPADCVYNPEES
jgi:ATP-dependent DNA ligase